LLWLFLEIESCFLPRLAWIEILLFYASHHDRDLSPCPAIDWDGIFRSICLDWSWTLILLIAVSQVARIIGDSHWHSPSLTTFIWDCTRGLSRKN
jgi:hypothetical protein